MTHDIHICSLVVLHQPGQGSRVTERILEIPVASIPFKDDFSKLVVVLETQSEASMLEYMSRIAAVPGVVSSNLVYQQHEALESIDEEVII